MSIEKKSLISTLKTTKKANAAASAPEGFVKSEPITPKRANLKRASLKRASLKREVF